MDQTTLYLLGHWRRGKRSPEHGGPLDKRDTVSLRRQGLVHRVKGVVDEQVGISIINSRVFAREIF